MYDQIHLRENNEFLKRKSDAEELKNMRRKIEAEKAAEEELMTERLR